MNYDKCRNDIKKQLSSTPNTLDRRHSDLECGDMKLESEDYLLRSECTRDVGRLLFTKAFRRLEHKAQVYSHEMGDHFRTRLTHTLEVSSIAKSLGKNLGLNLELIEAIALGHDIGHTPFGHEGERALDDIMRGSKDLGGLINYPINHGGFKHNFQSVRVLDILEKKHKNIDGLNLTWQVLDGILKHTKIKKKDKEWKLERFITEHKSEFSKFLIKLAKEYKYPATLEGQVVCIADEVAQRQHDLDDGLRDTTLNLKVEDVMRDIIRTIKEILNETKEEDIKELKFKLLDKLKENLRENLKILIKNKHDIEIVKYCKNKFTRDIIDYFIKDITYNSFKTLEMILKEDGISKIKYESYTKCSYYVKYIDGDNPKLLIDFSDVGNRFNGRLEGIVEEIVRSNDVRRFDAKANYIIRQLFKAYYRNPDQLPNNTLKMIEYRLNKNLDKFCKAWGMLGDKSAFKELINKIWGEGDNLLNDDYKFNFETGIPENVQKLLKLDDEIIFKSLKKCNEYNFINEYTSIDSTELKKYYENINKKEIEDINSKKDLIAKWLLENNYIYMSSICDHIAGMTDNYAKKEYELLY
jgi:dGTPase